MGVKGKLSVSIEVQDGGHLIYDFLLINSQHISNISWNKVLNSEIQEGEIINIDSI